MKRTLMWIIGLLAAGALIGFLVRLLWPRRIDRPVSRTAELRSRT